MPFSLLDEVCPVCGAKIHDLLFRTRLTSCGVHISGIRYLFRCRKCGNEWDRIKRFGKESQGAV